MIIKNARLVLSDKVIEKPKNINMVISLAETLSTEFNHVRVDFYIVDGEIYFGEMTFFHGTGFGKWTPESFDAEMGSWMDLSSLMK